jgi:hypothetical protein
VKSGIATFMPGVTFGPLLNTHLVRAKDQIFLAITLAIVLISFGSVNATEIPCQDLETANADELLATVEPQSIRDGGSVQVGESGCDLYSGQKACEWRTTLEDDQMLDRDHRLIYVLSSHQTGSGSWQDLLVFGCVSGRVKKVFLGQIDRDTRVEEVLNSAPPELRSALVEYLNHIRTMSPIDCDRVVAELQSGKKVTEVAKDMNVLQGSVNRCREAARKASGAGMAGPAAVASPPVTWGFKPAGPQEN